MTFLFGKDTQKMPEKKTLGAAERVRLRRKVREN